MVAPLKHLIESRVVRSAMMEHAQQRARHEGISLWEALHARDPGFIDHALEPKRAFYYRQDVQQFEAARTAGQPLDLRTYFPPNLHRASQQEEVESFLFQLMEWGLAPVAWTDERIWGVGRQPTSFPTALKAFLFAKRKLHQMPAPPEQFEEYYRMTRNYLELAIGIEGTAIRLANTILQHAVDARVRHRAEAATKSDDSALPCERGMEARADSVASDS